jgi:hypothetical protein
MLVEKKSAVASLLLSSPRRRLCSFSPLLSSSKIQVTSYALTAHGTCDGGLVLIEDGLEGSMFKF